MNSRDFSLDADKFAELVPDDGGIRRDHIKNCYFQF